MTKRRNLLLHYLFKLPTLLVKKTEALSALSLHLVLLTGKYPFAIHPKHLLPEGKFWYINLLKKQDRILDIGCHQGQHTLLAAKKVRHIEAFDCNTGAIDQARFDARRTGTKNVNFFLHDANCVFPFKDGRFDAVLFFAVLEHLTKREQALNEARRVLKKGGYLFLSVPNRNTLWKRWQRSVGITSFSDPDHKIEFTRASVTKLLKRTGFQIIEVQPVAIDMPGVGMIDLLGGLSLFLYRYFALLRRKLVYQFPAETVAFQVIARKGKRR